VDISCFLTEDDNNIHVGTALPVAYLGNLIGGVRFLKFNLAQRRGQSTTQ